jgi:hypothetical protein
MKSVKKKSFSSFTLKTAFKKLNLETLLEWQPTITAIPPSEFFRQRHQRLKQHFDLSLSERSRELLIDLLCEEALLPYPRLKVWKAAPLEGEDTIGTADYLVAENRGYLDGPLLCVVEAKKDDFEQGEAQCLVEMQACRWENQLNGDSFDVFGIVTNGEGWKFYKLDTAGKVHATLLYSIADLEVLLGWLRWIFATCENFLKPKS